MTADGTTIGAGPGESGIGKAAAGVDREPGRAAGGPRPVFLALDGKDLRLWAVTFGAALGAVALVYLAAFLMTPGGYRFSGFLVDSHDAWSYRAWSNFFAQDGLLVDNPYSAYARRPAYFNLDWFVIGKLMRHTGLPFLPLYLAFGAAAGALMYLAILALMRDILPDRAMAWCAYLLAGFGSGLGWIFFLISPDYFGTSILMTDLTQLDGFPLDALLTFPHISFSIFLLVALYLCLYRATTRPEKRWLLAAGGLCLLIGFSHPYQFVTLAAVMVVWYGWMNLKHGRAWTVRWLNLLVPAAGMLPGLAYYAWLTSASPNFAFWKLQNVMETRGWLSVILAFGPMMPFVILGYRGFTPVRRHADRYLMVVAWALVNFALLFSRPLVAFEGRLIQGLIFPMAVLATWGIFGTFSPAGPLAGAAAGEAGRGRRDARPRGARRVRVALAAAAVLLTLSLPDHILVAAKHLMKIREQGAAPVPMGAANEDLNMVDVTLTTNTRMILHRGELEALAFLRRHARYYPLVLSTTDIGLVMPAFAPVRSYLGHVGLTPAHKFKLARVKEFLADDDRSRSLFLGRNKISFVWWGPEEAAMSKKQELNAPYLGKIFDNGLVRIYEVKAEYFHQ